MNITLDNQVVRLFCSDADKILSSPLPNQGKVRLNWPSLLEYIEMGNLLEELAFIDQEHPLFMATTSALCEVANPEDLFYIFDSLFTAVLKQVKAHSVSDASFLLQKIEEKKSRLSFLQMQPLISDPLSQIETRLKEEPAIAIHDLVLYLSWDRMCVLLGRIFDHQSDNATFQYNLKALRWCLVESFQHILEQGKTSPSFYRMAEAFFYYHMREEHLQSHREEDWRLLTESFSALTNPNEFADVFYIDYGLKEEPLLHATLETPEMVQRKLDLATYVIEQIRSDIPQWRCSLKPCPLIHL